MASQAQYARRFGRVCHYQWLTAVADFDLAAVCRSGFQAIHTMLDTSGHYAAY